MTHVSEAQTRSRRVRSPVGFFARCADNIIKTRLTEKLDGALTIVLPNGKTLHLGPGHARQDAPVVKLKNFRILSGALFRGGLGFAEAYIKNDVECSDLTAVFKFYLRNRSRLKTVGGRYLRARSFDRLAHLVRGNSLRGSRRNISEHYDLGNAFYEVWLDPDMNYSSGLYRDGVSSLEEAQRAKLDRVRTLLSPRPGASILEVGCGWGAFACRAAQMDQVRVDGITLSREQLRFARRRAERQNLSGVARFHLRDYRATKGTYDHIVSIEMIEAVGEAYWQHYFRMLSDRLKPGGSAIIQAITIHPDIFDRYRRRPDFIQRYIFPGGMLLTPHIIKTEAERCGLSLVHSEHFGASYAETLRCWRQRFDAAWPSIAELGFDARFRRRWNYYLTYCEAGFDEAVIDVGLYKLVKS